MGHGYVRDRLDLLDLEYAQVGEWTGRPTPGTTPAAAARIGACSSAIRHPLHAYYRVSTAKQGRSGLGIEAQQAAVERYLNGGNWKVVETFTEIESGRNSERPALAKALAAARVRQAPIVVAKVDRLTRSVGFLSMLLDAGVDVRFADLPQIEGTAGRGLRNGEKERAKLSFWDYTISHVRMAWGYHDDLRHKVGGLAPACSTRSTRCCARATPRAREILVELEAGRVRSTPPAVPA
jgi:Resolvase, N terminal domain